MSKGLENLLPFINAVTADYPWGDIKDDTGAGDGTAVNRANHADYHQTFRKLLALANITPNGLPDNVTNGYQYITALNYLYRRLNGVFVTSTSVAINVVNIRKLISVEAAVGTVDLTILSSFSNFIDGDSVIIRNNGNFMVRVLRTAPDTFAINGLGAITPIELPTNGDSIELVLEKSTNTWRAVVLKSTPIVVPVPKTVISRYNTLTNIGAAATTVILFPNQVLDVDNQFDVATGKFVAKAAGLFQLNVVLNITGSVSFPVDTVTVSVYKNGVLLGNAYSALNNYTGVSVNLNFSTVLDIANNTDEYTIVFTNFSGVSINVFGEISYSFVNQ